MAEAPEFQEEIQEALIVHPGDKLLVRVHPAALPEDVDVLVVRLRERFPGVEVTVVAAEQLAVVRG